MHSVWTGSADEQRVSDRVLTQRASSLPLLLGGRSMVSRLPNGRRLVVRASLPLVQEAPPPTLPRPHSEGKLSLW